MEFLKSLSSVTSRRKFLAISALIVGGTMMVKGLFKSRKPQPAKLKFLTRDGKLVEVDANNIPEHKRKIGNRQLVSWIWKNQKL